MKRTGRANRVKSARADTFSRCGPKFIRVCAHRDYVAAEFSRKLFSVDGSFDYPTHGGG